MSKPPINILLIEDNEGDVELIRTAFAESDLLCTLAVAHNGVEAVDFLFKWDKFANVPKPDLILLDLNMPRMNGKEFLGVIKEDDKLKSIPIIVLTSSKAPGDIMESYLRHANCYILKPQNIDSFIEVTRQVENFWINLVQLPQEAA